MDERERLARQLRRHATRRREGTPTVSVWVGELSSGTARLERALGQIVVTRSAPRGVMAEAWLDAIERSRDLPRLALCRAVGSEGEEVHAAWAARTPSQRRMWLRELRDHADRGDARAAARWLLERCEGGVRTSDEPSVLCSLVAVLPLEQWPALCVSVNEPDALREVAELCLLVPRLPVAAVVSEDAWRVGLGGLGPRARALLSEGLLEPSPLRGLDRPPPAVRRVAEHAPSTDVVLDQALHARAQAREALTSGRDDASELGERARSLAELLLFELLEGDSRTRGLFVLNGSMPFRFGPRAAEIDLVCRSLTIAIEVDGYHHFTEKAAYRRDRRKDVLLQTEGFWIIRFLADDVLERGSELVCDIVDLVTRRMTETTSRKENP